MPSASASAVAAITTAAVMLLHSLATCPAPLSPAWTIIRPIACRIGSARAKSASLPPTMKDSVASVAPPGPPETGASSIAKPLAAAARDSARLVSGLMVEQSISSGRAASVSISPRDPDARPKRWRRWATW